MEAQTLSFRPGCLDPATRYPLLLSFPRTIRPLHASRRQFCRLWLLALRLRSHAQIRRSTSLPLSLQKLPLGTPQHAARSMVDSPHLVSLARTTRPLPRQYDLTCIHGSTRSCSHGSHYLFDALLWCRNLQQCRQHGWKALLWGGEKVQSWCKWISLCHHGYICMRQSNGNVSGLLCNPRTSMGSGNWHLCLGSMACCHRTKRNRSRRSQRFRRSSRRYCRRHPLLEIRTKEHSHLIAPTQTMYSN